MTNEEYRDSLTQTDYYKSLTKNQQIAYLRSLNVLFPINDQWILHWDVSTKKQLGRDACNELSGYFVKYRQELVYNAKVHDDVDVVAYHIVHNEEIDMLGKTELLSLNQYRFFQDFERGARSGRAYANKFSAARKEKAFRTEQAQQAIKKQQEKQVVYCDKLFVADKQLQSLYQPIALIMPAEFIEETDWIDEIFVTESKIDKESMSLLLTHIDNEKIYLMDSEHEKVVSIENNEKWIRRYKELAILDFSGELLYSEYGEKIDREAVKNMLKGKLVLCKGIQAELDFVKNKYVEYRTTAEHQAYNKCHDDKGIACVFFDLDMMNVNKYNGYHISANELEFFRLELQEQQQRIMDRVNKDPFLLRRAQIVALRVMFVWRKIYPELESAYLTYYASLSSDYLSLRRSQITNLQYKEVTDQDYRGLLFSLMLGTKFFYSSIGCYVHNSKKCKKCYMHRLSRLVKEKLRDVNDSMSDLHVDKFLTYLCVKYNVPASALYWKLEEELDILNESAIEREYDEFSQQDWVFFLHQEFGE